MYSMIIGRSVKWLLFTPYVYSVFICHARNLGNLQEVHSIGDW